MNSSRQTARTAAVLLSLIFSAGQTIGQPQDGPSTGRAASTAAQSVFIRILPHSMEPETITVKPGRVLIIVQNRSTAPNVTLQLDKVDGTHLKTVRMVSGQRHSQETYELAAGDYLITEANHPAWKCKITAK